MDYKTTPLVIFIKDVLGIELTDTQIHLTNMFEQLKFKLSYNEVEHIKKFPTTKYPWDTTDIQFGNNNSAFLTNCNLTETTELDLSKQCTLKID